MCRFGVITTNEHSTLVSDGPLHPGMRLVYCGMLFALSLLMYVFDCLIYREMCVLLR